MKKLLHYLLLLLPITSYCQDSLITETYPSFSMEGYDSENSNQNIYLYIAKNLKYPKNARDNCQSGTIIITFDIDSTGAVVNDSVWFDHYPLLIAESKRIFYSTSGHWTPGTQDGKKVYVEMTLPFRFTIDAPFCLTHQDYYDNGLAYFDKGDFEKAAQSFKLALWRQPRNNHYIYNTAISYLKQSKIDSACQYLKIPVDDDEIITLKKRFCDGQE